MMPTPPKPIDPAMLSWAEERRDAARETLRRAGGLAGNHQAD